MSLVCGQLFRSLKRFDPRPDRVVAFGLDRVGLGIPSRPIAWILIELAGTPEIREKHVNYKWEREGMPLFTSPTLNIMRIEVECRGVQRFVARVE